MLPGSSEVSVVVITVSLAILTTVHGTVERPAAEQTDIPPQDDTVRGGIDTN